MAKKMKSCYLIAVVLMSFVLIGAIAGCSSSNEPTTTKEETAVTQQKSSDEKEEAGTAQETEKSGEKQQAKEDEKVAEQKKDEETKEEAIEQIVSETTNYDVIRADMREGFTGDVEVMTANTTDFGESYAILQPDGQFSFEIMGVPYNGTISLGEEKKHLYSGDENAKVTQLLFDESTDATVGDVLVEGCYVDNYILIDLTTTVDGKFTQGTFYLSKHIDE